MDDFRPVVRFAVMSDVHIKEPDCVERYRLEKGLKDMYEYAAKQEYNRVDGLFVVGDFANKGEEEQMRTFKKVCDECLKPETDLTVSVASHEFMCEGEEAAKEKLKRIFGMEPDAHKVLNGFHFISVSSTRGCHFDEPQLSFADRELKIARDDDPKKPIFFFQHPHITDTVYCSTYWGEDELMPVLVNYPQIIDFSGHSHAPINDPRSIHQNHFTSIGTGTLSYFELDEFDKPWGAFPPEKEKAAQMLIVEADADNRVKVRLYDIITGNFFKDEWNIETPSDPDTFVYTTDRYKNPPVPYFEDASDLAITVDGGKVKFDFAQAKTDSEYVDDYFFTIRRKTDNAIVKRFAVWSEYYFYEMPDRISYELDGMEKGEYTVNVKARGFWNNSSRNSLNGEFTL